MNAPTASTEQHAQTELQHIAEAWGDKWLGRFKAMSCPCETIITGATRTEAEAGLAQISTEAWRIEQKYSRFRADSVIGKINTNAGSPVEVDAETTRLIDTAFALHELSEGQFDISAGLLSQLWKFDRSDQLPDEKAIAACLPQIGMDKLDWSGSTLTLAPGMVIDLGGIGKEYAADRCLGLALESGLDHVLVNLGGDIAASAPHSETPAWRVAIEQVSETFAPDAVISLAAGGVATSGDSRRFIEHNGQRYGHVLNPKTGWPIIQAPRSVTVLASSATEAGMYSTLAMLAGAQAEAFLQDSAVPNWIQR